MRKLKRSIAKFKMEKAGFERLNKKTSKGKSFFALNWRQFVFRKLPKAV
jgi:hypothetical protein